jgi:thiosulfate/3-mercaptopyruvate sulfurtransferase
VPDAARLIDSREPDRYAGDREPIDPVAGHIPGAVNYYWRRNLDENGHFRPAQEVRRDLLMALGEVPAEEAVFYCGSGVTACHNLLAAAWAGLPPPRLYAGSWSEWCRDPRRPVAVSARR